MELTNKNIGVVIEDIRAFFGNAKVSRKDLIKICLVVEEALLRYQEKFGEDYDFNFITKKWFGTPRILIRIKGTPYNPLEDNDEEQIFSEYQISEDKTIIGKIIIPKISVEAPIKEGTSAEVLKKSVGHFSSTKYWNGNICLASHNRGTYAHYFENINKLGPNDEIMYQTKLGTRVYVVESIKEISEHDFSVLNDTGENCITLITCVKNKSDKRLCLKAIEKA